VPLPAGAERPGAEMIHVGGVIFAVHWLLLDLRNEFALLTLWRARRHRVLQRQLVAVDLSPSS
jgi:hypothetical protein